MRKHQAKALVWLTFKARETRQVPASKAAKLYPEDRPSRQGKGYTSVIKLTSFFI